MRRLVALLFLASLGATFGLYFWITAPLPAPPVDAAKEAKAREMLDRLRVKYDVDELVPERPVISVDFDNTVTGDSELAVLGGCARLNSLLTPHEFGRNRVTDKGLEYLKGLTRLKYVHLREAAAVSSAGLVHLTNSPTLEVVFLDYTSVDDEGLEQIARMAGLRTLSLAGTRITNAGLGQLKNLKHLDHLDLSNTQVDDAGLENLKMLPQLEQIVLYGTKVTDQGLNGLRQALPRANIWPDSRK